MVARVREIRPVRGSAGRCQCCENKPARHDYDGGRVCVSCLDFLRANDTKTPTRNR